MKIDATLPKGTRDYSPKEMEIVQFILDKVKETYVENGFNQVKTPILANLSLLAGGDSGDNSKMMFKTIKRGAKLDLIKSNLKEEDLVEEGLRYDLTVPVSRFYASNINDLPKPFKLFQIGESFRAEKPQKARDREFIQCDIDMFGEDTNLAEIEIILSVMQVYKRIGIKNVVFKINDRRILNQLILSAGFNLQELGQVLIVIDKFDKIGYEGIEKEMLELNFNSKKVNALINSLKIVREKGLKSCLTFGVDIQVVNSLQEIIDVVSEFKPNNYSIIFDTSIVRGQSYYTGAVFEAYCKEASFSRAIGGGGRYDNMLEKYLGTTISAVGYGLGLVPCSIILQEQGINQENQKKKISIVYSADCSKTELIKIKQELLKDFDVVALMPDPKNFKAFTLKMQNLGYFGIFRMKDKKLIQF